VCILYIVSEYNYLQSILISCRCIPKLNVSFVWKPISIDPSKNNHDIIYLFFKFYQYWGCDNVSLYNIKAIFWAKDIGQTMVLL